MAQQAPRKRSSARKPEQPSYRRALELPGVSILATSRGASKMASAVVSYGAMVYLASQQASQLEVSIIAASTYAAALLFGIQGGSLSDSLSKRIALVIGYMAQAALCLLVPYYWGTDVGALMFIMFLTSAINQIVTPSIKSATALVATPAQMATVAATISIAGSVASAVGSAFLAPLLIKYTSINVVLAVGGLIYIVGAVRTWGLPRSEQAGPLMAALRSVEWRPRALSLSANAKWIVSQRGVATMILVGGIVVAMFEAFNTLIPIYVRDVLDSDPANSVFIFAPAGIGFLLGTLATPALMGWMGERKLALVALGFLSVSMVLFGMVELVAPYLAPFSPLRVVEWLTGMNINDKVLAASFIALPANFGSTAAGASVQVYINRRVPLETQGATFGLQEVQENALTLVAVMGLGGIANIVGAQLVFIFTPFVAIGAVLLMLRYAYRDAIGTPLGPRAAFGMLADASFDEPKRRRRRKVQAKP
jgi:MFS family permease